MPAVSLMFASQVLVIDQGIEVVARRLVPVLSERPLTAGLGLIWQTVNPAFHPTSGILTMWIAVSVVVVIGLTTVVRRSGPGFVPGQAVAMGLLLGGSFSHLVDLLHWGEVVATLHVTLPGIEAVTGVARLAQWLGLLMLVVSTVRRRRAA
jgi:lipoprotein signal peptidase